MKQQLSTEVKNETVLWLLVLVVAVQCACIIKLQRDQSETQTDLNRLAKVVAELRKPKE